MKQYGMQKATEFTKKQINVLYAMGKRGEIKIENWLIKEMYEMAEFYGYDYNKSIEEFESWTLRILNEAFKDNKDYERINELLAIFTEKEFTSYSHKKQKSFDRNYLS